MIVGGIDLDSLAPQFDSPVVPGRTLIFDGDGPCYEATASAKRLTTALSRFATSVATMQFLTGAQDVRIHLTPKGSLKCNRWAYPTIKPYQGNRKDKAKPPLLEALRDLISSHGVDTHPEWVIVADRQYEADDTMMMDAYTFRERGIIDSADKDLRMTPYPYWDHGKGKTSILANPFGYIAGKAMSGGSIKVVGHGRKFFWAQMLMGDPVDNIAGLTKYHGKLCGAVKALTVLEHVEDESEAANIVLWAYAMNKQNPLAEAEMLWLRRAPDDTAFAYVMGLDIDPKLQPWLRQLNDYNLAWVQANILRKQHERAEEAAAYSDEAMG